MITITSIQNDDRFYVNPTTLDNIFHRDNNIIVNYKLVWVEVGWLRRTLLGKLSPLYETEPYLLLKNPENDNAINIYSDYCNLPGARKDNPERSVDYFKSFIGDFTCDYDIKKGAIIIDQYYRIQDGLHRSCILLNKYGPDYKIQVVRIYLKNNIRMRYSLFKQMCFYNFKHKLYLL